jgi:hypothetical protein
MVSENHLLRRDAPYLAREIEAACAMQRGTAVCSALVARFPSLAPIQSMLYGQRCGERRALLILATILNGQASAGHPFVEPIST